MGKKNLIFRTIVRTKSFYGIKGFTLLELIASIVIAGALAGLAFAFYTDYKEKAQVAKACVELQGISASITTYYTEYKKYPDTLQEVGLERMLDPWGTPYQYLNIQDVSGKGKFRKDRFLVPINTDYDLYSMGKDRRTAAPLTAAASKDDIIRARNGAYYGLAKDF